MSPLPPVASRAVAWLRARPRLSVTLALLAAPAILLREPLFGGLALYQRDIHLYWHAEAEAFVRALAQGAWPLWDRTVGFGQPLLANSSAQAAYPLTWLNLVMRPWWYYTLFVAFHLVLSAAGAYAACRALGGSRWAGLASGVLWTACGPFLSLTILWHHFAGAAWMPWVLAAALRLGGAPGPARAATLGAAMGLQVLAGSFDMAAMGAATAAAAVLWSLSGPGAGGPAGRRVLAHAGIAAALALGLSAAQWMPTVELALRSGRRALPRDVRTYWSLHPAALPDLVLPGFSGRAALEPAVKREVSEGREPFLASLYLGLATTGLVLAGLLDAGRRRPGPVLAGAAVAAGLVALGRHSFFYDALVAVVPPLAAFRYPVKVTVLVALAWCLLAGLGVDRARALAPGSRAARILRAGALAVPVAALVAAAAAGATGILVAAAMAGLAGACVVAALRDGGRRTAFAMAAALVAGADLVLYHRSMNDGAPIALYTHEPEVIRHLGEGPDVRVYAYDYSAVVPGAPAPAAEDPGLGRLARVPAGWPLGPAIALAQQMALTPLAGSRWGLAGSFEVDYTGLFPPHVNQVAYLLRSLEGTPAHRRLLRRAGVTRVVARHQRPFADLEEIAAVPGLYEAPIRVYAVPDPLPRAFVAPRSRPVDAASALPALVDPAGDPGREVLVPASAAPARGARPGRARIVAARADALTVEADAPDGGYLVVLESYDPGWRATVDGVEAAVVPADVLFRGVAVAPGAHVIEMTYRPAGAVAGLAVSGLALLATAALAWRARRPRTAAA